MILRKRKVILQFIFSLINLVITVVSIFTITNLQASDDQGLIYQDNPNLRSNWYSEFDRDEKRAFKWIIGALEKSNTAKLILVDAKRKASREGKTLLDIVVSGQVSLTDLTVVRKFLPESPQKIQYKYDQVVRISSLLTVMQAMTDFIHEFVHYSYREIKNPYETNLSLAQFIKHTVEDEGGEAHAAYVECLVAAELWGKENLLESHCQKLKQGKEWNREVVIKDFYKVGKDYDAFVQYFISRNGRGPASDSVTNEFPFLSKESSIFVSAAYDLSYPLAAIREYYKVKNTVCINEAKRKNMLTKMLKVKTNLSGQGEIQRSLATLENKCGI